MEVLRGDAIDVYCSVASFNGVWLHQLLHVILHLHFIENRNCCLIQNQERNATGSMISCLLLWSTFTALNTLLRDTLHPILQPYFLICRPIKGTHQSACETWPGVWTENSSRALSYLWFPLECVECSTQNRTVVKGSGNSKEISYKINPFYKFLKIKQFFNTLLLHETWKNRLRVYFKREFCKKKCQAPLEVLDTVNREVMRGCRMLWALRPGLCRTLGWYLVKACYYAQW